MGVGVSVDWGVYRSVDAGVGSTDGITFGIDDGSKLGSSDGFLTVRMPENLLFHFYMSHLNQMMEIHLIYMKLTEMLMMG